MIKNGTRLASQVCDTQVIVVRSSDSLDDLRCGGAPMVPIGGERSGELDPAFADGTVMGSYVAGDKTFCIYLAANEELIRKHAELTNSERSRQVLADWPALLPKFVKVYPNDYRRVIETQKRYKAQGLSDDEAIMAAFEENAHDAARVGGR